jgi:pyrroline-5-carboxylate reductase
MKNVAIIGCGKIGEQILKNFCKSRKFSVKISRRDERAGRRLARKYGAAYFRSNIEAIKGTEVVFLCVKPDQLPEVLRGLEPHLSKDQVLVSVAAGISIYYIRRFFPKNRIARYMPSTLIRDGKGVALLAGVLPKGYERLIETWSSKLYKISDKEIHLYTALASCGSVFAAALLLDTLDMLSGDGKKKDKLKRLIAEVGIETLSSLKKKSLKECEEIVEFAATPDTMTIEGIEVLREDKTRGALGKAILASVRRSEEMQKEYEK